MLLLQVSVRLTAHFVRFFNVNAKTVPFYGKSSSYSKKVKTNKFFKKSSLQTKLLTGANKHLSFKQLIKKFVFKKKVKRFSGWRRNKKPYWRQKFFIRARRCSNFILPFASHIRGSNPSEVHAEDINERHSWTFNVKYRRARFAFKNKIYMRRLILQRYNFKTKTQLKNYQLKIYKSLRPLDSGFNVLEGRLSRIVIRLGWLRSFRLAAKVVKLGGFSINGGVPKNPNTVVNQKDFLFVRKQKFVRAVRIAKKFSKFYRRRFILPKISSPSWRFLKTNSNIIHKRRFQKIKKFRLLQLKLGFWRKKGFKRKKISRLLKKTVTFYKRFVLNFFSYFLAPTSFISTVLAFYDLVFVIYICAFLREYFFFFFYAALFTPIVNKKSDTSRMLSTSFITFKIHSIVYFATTHAFLLVHNYDGFFYDRLIYSFLLTRAIVSVFSQNFRSSFYNSTYSFFCDLVSVFNGLVGPDFSFCLLELYYICYTLYYAHLSVQEDSLPLLNKLFFFKKKKLRRRKRVKHTFIKRARRKSFVRKKRKLRFKRSRFFYYSRRVPWKAIKVAMKYVGLRNRLLHPLPTSVFFKNSFVLYNELFLKKLFLRKKVFLRRVRYLASSSFFNLFFRRYNRHRNKRKLFFAGKAYNLLKRHIFINFKRVPLRPTNKQFELSRRKACFILISRLKFSSFAWLKSANFLQLNRRVFDSFSNQKLY